MNLDKVFLAVLSAASMAVVLYTAIDLYAIRSAKNACSMTYSWPVNTPLNIAVHDKYSVYSVHMKKRRELTGAPVLFVPGHLGSYKQARSIARHGFNKRADMFDFFTVDFNSELGALSGDFLRDQSLYINEVVQDILNLYTTANHISHKPSSVLVFSHSMGGVVTRLAVSQHNYLPGSIQTIFSFSTPHHRPPFAFDESMQKVYDEVNAYWKEAYETNRSSLETEVSSSDTQNERTATLENTVLISLAGGYLDLLIHSSSTSLKDIVPTTHSLTSLTSNLPSVKLSIDHLCLLWCSELLVSVTEGMSAIIDPVSKQQIPSAQERLRKIKLALFRDAEISTTRIEAGLAQGYLAHDHETHQLSSPWWFLSDVARKSGSNLFIFMLIVTLLMLYKQLLVWQTPSSTSSFVFPSLSSCLSPLQHLSASCEMQGTLFLAPFMACIACYHFYQMQFDITAFSALAMEYVPLGVVLYGFSVGIMAPFIFSCEWLAVSILPVRKFLGKNSGFRFIVSGKTGFIIQILVVFGLGHIESFANFDLRPMNAVRELSLAFLTLVLVYIIQVHNLLYPTAFHLSHAAYHQTVFLLHFISFPCWVGIIMYFMDCVRYDKDFSGEFLWKVVSYSFLLVPSVRLMYLIDYHMVPVHPAEKYRSIQGFEDAQKYFNVKRFVSVENCTSCLFEEGGKNAEYEETIGLNGKVFRVVSCSCLRDETAVAEVCAFCSRTCLKCGGGDEFRSRMDRLRSVVLALREEQHARQVLPLLVLVVISYLLLHPFSREYRMMYATSFVAAALLVFHGRFGSNLDMKHHAETYATAAGREPTPGLSSPHQEPMMYELRNANAESRKNR